MAPTAENAQQLPHWLWSLIGGTLPLDLQSTESPRDAGEAAASAATAAAAFICCFKGAPFPAPDQQS
jgi:hypothetical protein